MGDRARGTAICILQPRQTTSATTGPGSEFSRQHGSALGFVVVFSMSMVGDGPDFDFCRRPAGRRLRSCLVCVFAPRDYRYVVGNDVCDRGRVGRPPWTDVDPAGVRQDSREPSLPSDTHIEDGHARVEALALPLEVASLEMSSVLRYARVLPYTSSASVRV
jgi:hypothetical protein